MLLASVTVVVAFVALCDSRWGRGFGCFFLWNVNSVILSVKRCSCSLFIVILTVFVLKGVYGGYCDSRGSL